MVKNIKNPNSQGGYSDIRLWPCYLVVSSLILFLTPRLGFIISLILISTPALFIAKKVAAKIPESSYDTEAWSKDFYTALANDLPVPNLSDYAIITKKQPSPKTGKLNHQRLHKALPATPVSL